MDAGAPPYITATEVDRLVTMGDVIEVVREALVQFSAGGVVQPVRSAVPVKEHGG